MHHASCMCSVMPLLPYFCDLATVCSLGALGCLREEGTPPSRCALTMTLHDSAATAHAGALHDGHADN